MSFHNSSEESARQKTIDFLLRSGAERLPQDSALLPGNLKNAQGDAFLLPFTGKKFSRLIVHLSPVFPLELPSFYLTAADYGALHIPHVDHRGFICVVPHDTTIDPNQAEEAVCELLNRAKRIIETPWTDAGAMSVMLPEIKAYWHDSHPLQETILLSEKGLDPTKPRILPIHYLGKRRYYARCNPNMFAQAMCALVRIEFSSVHLPRTHADLFTLLRYNSEFTAVLDALRAAAFSGHVAQKLYLILEHSIPGGIVHLGVRCLHAPTYRNLVSKSSEARYEFLSRAGKKLFRKLRVEEVSTKRLLKRAADLPLYADISSKKIALIGCGSLGGFIADFLVRSGIQNLWLCDNEPLCVENVPRHLNPLNQTNLAKVQAVGAVIRARFPETNVFQRPQNAVVLIDEISKKGWNPSLTISTTANTPIEFKLSELCAAGVLGDTLYCWVEPHLAAGHLFYQRSGERIDFKDHFEVVHGKIVYKNRIVDNPSTYERLESGCQSAFSLFSGLDAIQFSAVACRKIVDWLLNSPTQSQGWIWVPESSPIPVSEKTLFGKNAPPGWTCVFPEK